MSDPPPNDESTTKDSKRRGSKEKAKVVKTVHHVTINESKTIIADAYCPEKEEEEDSTHLFWNFGKWKIVINKPLVRLKLALFCYYGAGSYMPSFMTVLYRQRGINLSQISSMTIVSPVLQVLGTTLSGIIADKIGRSKPVLIANILLVTAVVVCILVIPRIGRPVCVTFQGHFGCNSPVRNFLESNPYCRGGIKSLAFENGACNVLCLKNCTQFYDKRSSGLNPTYEDSDIKHVTTSSEPTDFGTRSVLEENDTVYYGDGEDSTYLEITHDDGDGSSNSISKQSSSGSFGVELSFDFEGNETLFPEEDSRQLQAAFSEMFNHEERELFGERNEGSSSVSGENQTVFYDEDTGASNTLLADGESETEGTTSADEVVPVFDENQTVYSAFQVDQCWSICCAKVCLEGQSNIETDYGLVSAYAVLFVLFFTSFSNVYRCLDITAMSLVKEHDSDYGRNRFFSSCGNLLISPLAGYFAELSTPRGGEKNYAATLYLFVFLNIILLGIIYKLPVRALPPGKSMWRSTFKLLKNMDALVFLIIIFVLGTGWNYDHIFVFWFLEDLNAPSLLIGLITSVSALYGLPFLLTSNWWVEKLGTHQIFVMALLAYAGNFIGYAFLQNPWFSLVLEVTNIMTYHLLWVAVLEFSHSIAPDGLTSTVIATAGAIHYSIGKASSALIGGQVMDRFGARTAFLLLSVLSLIFAAFYSTYICIKGQFSGQQVQLNDTSRMAMTSPIQRKSYTQSRKTSNTL